MVKLAPLIILLVLVVTLTSAQHSFSYQIQNDLFPSELLEDTTQIDSIADLAYEFRGSHLDSLLFYAQWTLNSSRAISYSKGIAKGYSYLGIYHYQKGNLSEAISFYLQAAKVFEALNDVNKLASVYNNVGLVYYEMEDFATALDYHLKAIQSSDYNQEPVVIANFMLNQANAKLQLGNLEETLSIYHEAIKILKNAGNITDLANLYLNLGNNFGREGLMDSVKIYFDKGLYLAELDDDYDVLSYALVSQTRYYTYTKDYGQALQYAKRSLDLADQFGSLQNRVNALYAISQLYEYMDSFKEALNYTKRHAVLKDSLSRKENSLEIARLEANAIVDKQQSLYNQELDFKERSLVKQRYIILLLFVFLATSLGLVYLILKKWENTRILYSLLEKRNQEINELSQHTEALNIHQQQIFKVLGHDLKGPVRSIATVTEMASQDEFTLEELKELLPQLSLQAKQLNMSLENLLHWAMEQMDGERLNASSIQVDSLIYTVLEFLDVAIKEKSLIVDVKAETSAYIMADTQMVMIGIRNVLANAVKFTPAGGYISIICRKVEGRVIIILMNEGKPVPEAIIDKFNNGQLIGESKTGTGIGLKLASSYISKNHGTVTMRNLPDVGVEVAMEFPECQFTPLSVDQV
ncbi:tetratricopeptide repeat protein [Litoribacter ruber]|uniref:tetratricopeptide repeat-containing sensor histidine kinase n=1 Tax=Litoribacter ruber TaxID=702568 RepID=UPI001BD96613|nr:tetratricopeptide repeat protein [Litoribacter ruber]MBT0810445.1 tetratricopeptide repeat protein [Litoribacter ruber]